jgi:uncharacterized membrane protein
MIPLEQKKEKYIAQSKSRILRKAVIYRIFIFFLTLFVTYLFLKDTNQTLKYTIIMEIITFTFYYLYELGWNLVPIST